MITLDISRQVSYTYDATGNRTDMTTDQGATSYKYDTAGRLLAEDGPSGTIANQYGPAGQRPNPYFRVSIKK